LVWGDLLPQRWGGCWSWGLREGDDLQHWCWQSQCGMCHPQKGPAVALHEVLCWEERVWCLMMCLLFEIFCGAACKGCQGFHLLIRMKHFCAGLNLCRTPMDGQLWLQTSCEARIQNQTQNSKFKKGYLKEICMLHCDMAHHVLSYLCCANWADLWRLSNIHISTILTPQE
jgi:hypothetical protein